MRILFKLLFSTIAVFVSAYILSPSVRVEGFATAFVVAIVLGILNTFMKPVLILLTLPINILTLGLFTFVINAALVFIASYLVPGFFVTSLLSAIIFSLMVSLINSFLNLLAS